MRKPSLNNSGCLIIAIPFWIVFILFFVIYSSSQNSDTHKASYSYSSGYTSSSSASSSAYSSRKTEPDISKLLTNGNMSARPLSKRNPNWKYIFFNEPQWTSEAYKSKVYRQGYTCYAKLTIYKENGEIHGTYWTDLLKFDTTSGWHGDTSITLDCSELPSGSWSYSWSYHKTKQ